MGTRRLSHFETYAIIKRLERDRTSDLYKFTNPDDWFVDDPYFAMSLNVFNGVRIIASRTPSPDSKSYKDPEPITRDSFKPKEKVSEAALISEDEIAAADWGFSMEDLNKKPSEEPTTTLEGDE